MQALHLLQREWHHFEDTHPLASQLLIWVPAIVILDVLLFFLILILPDTEDHTIAK